jgi:hypothetical protein
LFIQLSVQNRGIIEWHAAQASMCQAIFRE